jgi:hypothetical protein
MADRRLSACGRRAPHDHQALGRHHHAVERAAGTGGGRAFEAFAGCDRTFATCQSKFGNSLNFGGFPWIPAKNPFAGDSIV